MKETIYSLSHSLHKYCASSTSACVGIKAITAPYFNGDFNLGEEIEIRHMITQIHI